MSRLLRIPRYTGRDGTLLLCSMIPLTLLLNGFLFGTRYLHEPGLLLGATLLTFSVLALTYMALTRIGLLLSQRFPGPERSYLRLALALLLFLLSDFVILSLLLRGYDYFSLWDYRYNEGGFVVLFCFVAILTVFLTFLNEGIARYESYRRTLRETEQLRSTYLQSQLLGLKSQVNPHFLFNSLNTLSSLIHENAADAELFLDELSKVYRYLLRNNDGYLVELRKELAFIRSYAYLLEARHGSAYRLHIEVPEELLELHLPPLTLQFLMEDILEQNSFTRTEPLDVEILAMGKAIIVRNNRQPRLSSDRELSGEAVLRNIREKFALLAGKDIHIAESTTHRTIIIPLIQEQEPAWKQEA